MNARLSLNARRLAIRVRGVVQGVGFRPFVYNAARARGLAGWVQNQTDTVRIEVQGPPEDVEAFLDALRGRHPPHARIDSLDVREMECREIADAAKGDGPAFRILASAGRSAPRPTIPADLATCDECLAEIRDPRRRRYRYPLTNCTNCGPRWSIIERLPYDRSHTSMAPFEMCPACRREYEDPADRRFHAQPIACPHCGPMLTLADRRGNEIASGDDALNQAVASVLSGQILAMKGLGGFQLVADATDARAVALLRTRKQRPDKPFAVMLPSLADVRRHCEVSGQEAAALASCEAPIVLLRRAGTLRGGACPASPAAKDETPVAKDETTAAKDETIRENIAPGNPYLGVMLPCTPLHHLLMDAVNRPLVCTSGNLSEEPMAITTEDAHRRLGPIADVLLTHDRPIVRPVDDSIVRVTPDGLQVLRRARGFAPLPIDLAVKGIAPKRVPTILAVGGHLKNTVALSVGSQVVISPHVGDLVHPLSVEVHRRAIADLTTFFQTVPDVVACDLHPDYASTVHAEHLAADWDVPLVRVQHHHAHVAACMAEHQLHGPVLGFAWDGTGYGTDGTVWGGEMLRCEGGRCTRVAHLRTFALPGGDRAVREPRRSALGLLFEIAGDGAAEHGVDWFTEAELDILLSLLERSAHAPRTSSMGRLFDAVAALCSLATVIGFEGQAAMALEFAADRHERDAYPLPFAEFEGQGPVADWEPLLRAILADRAAGKSVGTISARFHNALARMAVEAARRCNCRDVVLTGGCFQNALLAKRTRGRLLEAGFNVYTHRKVPPGDGGIALGQVFIAAATTATTTTAATTAKGSVDVSRDSR